MFELGLKLWSHNKEYSQEAAAMYEKKLFSYIELYIVPQTFTQYASVWKNLKIPYIIHSTHSMHGFNLADRERRQANLAMFSEVRGFADELSSAHIIVHPGIVGSLEESIRQIALLNDARLVVENKPFISMNGEICRGSTCEEIMEIVASCRIGFCLDIPHAINAALHVDADPYEYVRKFLGLDPVLLHIADGRLSKIHDMHLNIGCGEYDFYGIARILTGAKARYMTVETQKRERWTEVFADDVEKIRSVCADNPTDTCRKFR